VGLTFVPCVFSSGMRLRNYPYIIVRFACRHCPRLGRYRVAVLCRALWRRRGHGRLAGGGIVVVPRPYR
jgi:hypothetical protein